MFRYSGFGLSIHSELELPDLPPGDDKPDVVICLGSVPRTRPRVTMHEEIAHHARGGSFHIKQGREIVVDPAPGVDPDLLRVLLLGRMMAFLLRQQGWLPLHASGVEIEGEAVLFLGPSGSGKSTLAAAFHARGHQVITDDVGAVRVVESRQCLVRPAGPRIRLLDDSLAVFDGPGPARVPQWRKYLFDVARGEVRKLIQVRRIYLLEYGSEIGSEIIPPLAAVAALSTHSFAKHERMDRDSLAAHLHDCSSVAGSLSVRRLVRPRLLGALPELVRWIETDFATGR
jgi:hypothetical protein